MKNEIRLALLLLATTAVPAIAQNASPLCGTSNFDATRSVFTVINPTSGTVNQQCFFIVYKSSDTPAYAKHQHLSFLVEGNYAIESSGGGGGGGGGASQNQGGGGGGAGAAPSHVIRYLVPGTYKMTIGTGGSGGSPNGGKTEAGNPTSLTNADSGQLIAGFQGADTWQQQVTDAGGGRGGTPSARESRGGNGGDSGPMAEEAAQSGGASRTSGYVGKPGEAGSESERRVDGTTQANAGGGGGAGVGNGGAGEAVNKNAVAGAGSLGGGGGGGRGGLHTADAGARGGHGFIRLSVLTPLI